jgi:hypothetical protein
VNGNYPTTSISVQALKPALAIRGVNCLLCHGNIGSNVVTDFGHNSDSNGLQEIDDVSNAFFGPIRTAYNDTEYSVTGAGGWQTGSINGNVYVPSEPISASACNTLFGINSSVTYSQAMSWTTGSNPLSATVQLPSVAMSGIINGTGVLTPLSQIHISYPTQTQILNAAGTGASLSQAPSVVQVSSASVSGLNNSTRNNFTRNGSAASPGSITCTGDVVVIGPLFLKDATVNTNDQGCRLYVTGTVVVQGPLTVQGSTNANLQISSAKAIVMGFDLLHLGYAFGTNGSSLRSANPFSLPLPDADSYIRFSIWDDPSYYPTNAPSGFSSAEAFFDSVVSDAILIDGGHLIPGKTGPGNWVGSELVDAFSTAQPSSAYVQADGGYRLAYDYSHIVFNAPQIHGRYGGSINGVMIGDSALFLLSGDASTSDGLGVNFSYDSTFDHVSQLLPLFPNIFTVGN